MVPFLCVTANSTRKLIPLVPDILLEKVVSMTFSMCVCVLGWELSQSFASSSLQLFSSALRERSSLSMPNK